VPYSRAQLSELSKKVDRSWRTLQYWASQGCNLNDPASLEAFLQAKELRKTNVQKFRERCGMHQPAHTRHDKESETTRRRVAAIHATSGNGDLPPVGKTGTGHTLRRLEEEEQRSFMRMQAALERGNPIEIQNAQEFWLKIAEVLRRLDAGVAIARRSEQEMIPLKTAQDCVLFVSEWLRISLSTLLSAEGLTLAGGFKTVGELKAYFIERFKGVMFLTLKNSGKTNSPIPPWALERIKTAFNVEEPQELATAVSGTPGP
jgi:hypothetical protein